MSQLVAGKTDLFVISSQTREKIDAHLKKFPADRKKSGVLFALKCVQADNQGWLSIAAMQAVAQYLELPQIDVYEVATFYSMYELKPLGRQVISVCTNVACQLNGCDALVKHLKTRLGIDWHETTPDGRFTLKPVECLAACDKAPVVLVGEDYHACPEINILDTLLEALP